MEAADPDGVKRRLLAGKDWDKQRQKHSGIKLLSYDELPEWRKDNFYIMSGYRPEFQNIWACFDSLNYMHNETINIYTHLLPAIFTIAAECLFFQYMDIYYPNATLMDRVMFGVFFLSAIACFSISASYHTFHCHSEDFSNLWLRIDFLGIVGLILGDFISGIYMGFYCEPKLQKLYWTMIVTLSVSTTFFVINPKYQGARYRPIRVALFLSTGLSAFAPIAHGVQIWGVEQMMLQSGMPYYLLEGLIMIIGAGFYMTRVPESLFPGKFDIWFASHQIFHVLVVIATVVHWLGISIAYDYAYMHRRCEA